MARNQIEGSVAAFLKAEAGRVAQEALPNRKGLNKTDHTDPAQAGAGITSAEIEAATAAALASIDMSRWSILAGDIAPQLAGVAQQTADETLAELGVTLTRVEADDLATWSATWAEDRAADLVHKDGEQSIARSTLDMVDGVFRQAFGSSATTAETLAEALLEAPAFSSVRAKRIADYETTNSVHEATLKSYHASNTVTAVAWNTMQDDDVEEVCLDNEDAGPIPLGDAFPSGDMRPPAHINCRCFLSPVVEFKHSAMLTKLSRVDPANATPTTLPQADPVAEADVQHAAWVLVRKDRLQLDERTVPIADMMACGQTVVDSERVARETRKWLERGQGKFRPLVMAHSGKFLILSGLHHTQAAVDAGASEMLVHVMSDKEQ